MVGHSHGVPGTCICPVERVQTLSTRQEVNTRQLLPA